MPCDPLSPPPPFTVTIIGNQKRWHSFCHLKYLAEKAKYEERVARGETQRQKALEAFRTGVWTGPDGIPQSIDPSVLEAYLPAPKQSLLSRIKSFFNSLK